VSDLQCPATFLVTGSGATEAASSLAGTRLAAAYAVPEGLAVAGAAAGGVPVSPLGPAGTSYAAVLEELADVHRGETVLVVLPEEAVATLASGTDAAPDGVLQVAVDGDGWSVRSWTSASAGRFMRD
jgi:hypothetical protein